MSPTQHQARKIMLRTAQASLLMFLILVVTAILYDVEKSDTLLLAFSIILANLPGIVWAVSIAIQKQAYRKIGAGHVRFTSDPKIDELANTRYLLIEQSDLLPVHDQVVSALKTAANANIRIAVFSDEAESKVVASAKQMFGSEPVILSEAVLARMKPKQLVTLVESSTVIFSKMSAKYKKHVQHALSIHGPTLLIGQTPQSAVRGHLWDILKAVRIARQTSENLLLAFRTMFALIPALFTLILVSLVLLTTYAINPVITPLQIAGLTLIGLLPSWIMLGHDESHRNLMKHAPTSASQLMLHGRDITTMVGLGVTAALLAILNHSVFYVRQDLDPAFLASDTPLYIQATTLTAITLLLCMYVHVLCNRVDSHKQVFTHHFLNNKKLLQAMAGSLLLLIIFMYTPALRVLVNLQPLSITDWLMAVLGSGLFLSVRFGQHYLKKYSRHAVVQLHHEVHGKK